jgi:hypothetical protein
MRMHILTQVHEFPTHLSFHAYVKTHKLCMGFHLHTRLATHAWKHYMITHTHLHIHTRRPTVTIKILGLRMGGKDADKREVSTGLVSCFGESYHVACVCSV